MATGPSNPGSISRGWFEKISDVESYGTTFPLVIPAAKMRGAETSTAITCLSATMFNNPDASVHKNLSKMIKTLDHFGDYWLMSSVTGCRHFWCLFSFWREKWPSHGSRDKIEVHPNQSPAS